MEWKKRNESLLTVEQIVENNVKIPINEFLNPPSNPYLANLDKAVSFAKEAMKTMDVTIVGDYDADGVCSTTILSLAVHEFTGKDPKIRIPRRFSEGYGLSMKIIDEIDHGLIITVDNGITALEQIKVAKSKGLKVIVIDHHLPITDEETGETQLPEADIIIDPHAIVGSEFCSYCGAGLAYRFAKELIPSSPLLEPLLVFASIATVTDVMPLVGDNRNIVIEGLNLIRKRHVTLGLNELLNEFDLSYITEGDYGFRIGPAINAAGRLFDDGPEKVVELLKTHLSPMDADYPNTINTCQERAKEMISWNRERQSLVYESMKNANQVIEDENLSGDIPLIVYLPTCSEGIVGIIAGHLAETYHTPCIVFTDSKKEGVIKGSGRSYGSVHLKKFLDKLSDHLLGYGGHEGAAGLSMRLEDLEAFRENAKKELERKEIVTDTDVMYYDLDISPEEIHKTFIELNKYAPFGEGNPQLVFKVHNFELCPVGGAFYKTMGNRDQHIKLYGKQASAVGFDLSSAYKEEEPHKVDLIGNLSVNYYRGKFYDQIEFYDFKKILPESTKAYQTLENLLMFA